MTKKIALINLLYQRCGFRSDNAQEHRAAMTKREDAVKVREAAERTGLSYRAARNVLDWYLKCDYRLRQPETDRLRRRSKLEGLEDWLTSPQLLQRWRFLNREQWAERIWEERGVRVSGSYLSCWFRKHGVSWRKMKYKQSMAYSEG